MRFFYRLASRRLTLELLEDRSVPTASLTTIPYDSGFVSTSAGGESASPGLLLVGSEPGGGEVRAFNPATQGQIFDLFPFGQGFTGGVNVAAADVNGDGVPDVVAAMASGGSQVVTVDGKTGTVLKSFAAFDSSFNGGASIAVGDVTRDGGPDIIVGAGPGGGPNVKVFDAATGTQIRSFYAFDPSFEGGVRLAVGYFDSDFTTDIVVGAGPGGGPNVKVIGGATGATIRSFFAYDPSFTGGVTVATGVGRADGLTDIITGSGANSPHVKVFDAATGAITQSFYAFSENGFGANVASVDLGNGATSIVVGPTSGGQSLVKVFSGKTNVQDYAGFSSGSTVAAAVVIYTVTVPPVQPISDFPSEGVTVPPTPSIPLDASIPDPAA